jgi:hypothetical protein
MAAVDRRGGQKIRDSSFINRRSSMADHQGADSSFVNLQSSLVDQ